MSGERTDKEELWTTLKI